MTNPDTAETQEPNMTETAKAELKSEDAVEQAARRILHELEDCRRNPRFSRFHEEDLETVAVAALAKARGEA